MTYTICGVISYRDKWGRQHTGYFYNVTEPQVEKICYEKRTAGCTNVLVEKHSLVETQNLDPNMCEWDEV